MKKKALINIIARLAEIIINNCETDEDIEQVKEGIEKYVDFLKSIPQT